MDIYEDRGLSASFIDTQLLIFQPVHIYMYITTVNCQNIPEVSIKPPYDTM
jgi:hypothetical protein